MGIDLCGSDRFMTQHFLHGSEICSSLNQMCRKGMPECMRRYFLFDPGLFRECLDDIEHHDAAELASTTVQKQYVLRFLLRPDMHSHFSPVDPDLLHSNTPDRYKPFLISFSGDPDE